MSLGENVSSYLAYKAYSVGTITANTEATSSSDPGTSGGQKLRRTTATPNLSKDTYQSAEIRSDRQVSDFRHGMRKANVTLNGELSPGTYFDFIEAMCRGTKTAAVATSNSDWTSVAADNATSTFTFTSGDPVALGYRVGMVGRFTNLSAAGNNSTNYLITGFSGTSNRVMAVYPAPTTMAADTTANFTSVGKRVFPPSSSFVSRKFGIESHHVDLDISRFFTECRIGGMKFGLPATGMSTVEISALGRDMETYSGGSAPFFTAPTAETTTGLLAAVNGLVRVGGVNVGVITAAQVNIDLSPDGPAVVGQNFAPEIFLGRFKCSGQITAFLQDLTLINAFLNETETELLFYLLTGSTATADAMTIYLPRNKFGDAQVGLTGEAGIPVTLPFTSLLYSGAGPGIDATTAAFHDTAA
jgi:hypothetical protein